MSTRVSVARGSVIQHTRTAVLMVVMLTVILGIVYPLIMTGLSQVLFNHQANGSLIRDRFGNIVGSALLAQNFSKPEYFHPRPSVAGNDGYDATSSGGSNWGPTNKKLLDRVSSAAENFRKENPSFTGSIPADMLMASASGLDPHLSPPPPEAQAERV